MRPCGSGGLEQGVADVLDALGKGDLLVEGHVFDAIFACGFKI